MANGTRIGPGATAKVVYLEYPGEPSDMARSWHRLSPLPSYVNTSCDTKVSHSDAKVSPVLVLVLVLEWSRVLCTLQLWNLQLLVCVMNPLSPTSKPKRRMPRSWSFGKSGHGAKRKRRRARLGGKFPLRNTYL
jgi:hypothetical protein